MVPCIDSRPWKLRLCFDEHLIQMQLHFFMDSVRLEMASHLLRHHADGATREKWGHPEPCKYWTKAGALPALPEGCTAAQDPTDA